MASCPGETSPKTPNNPGNLQAGMGINESGQTQAQPPSEQDTVTHAQAEALLWLKLGCNSLSLAAG